MLFLYLGILSNIFFSSFYFYYFSQCKSIICSSPTFLKPLCSSPIIPSSITFISSTEYVSTGICYCYRSVVFHFIFALPCTLLNKAYLRFIPTFHCLFYSKYFFKQCYYCFQVFQFLYICLFHLFSFSQMPYTLDDCISSQWPTGSFHVNRRSFI